MFFSLKLSQSQGESSLKKFQLAWVRRFGGVREQTNKQSNKQTDRLTDRHALLYSIRITVKEEFESSKLFGEEFWCSGEAKRIIFVKSTSNITRILIMK